MYSSSISCMTDTTFYISNDHLVYVFGNIDNNIFNEHSNNTHIPRVVKGLCDIKTIDCGNNHILCLDFNGNIFSFGANICGQLGIGKNSNGFSRTYIPQKIDIPPCKQIACGGDFSMCLTEEGSLYSFGSNICEQLGLGSHYDDHFFPQLIPDLHNVEYIACGGHHSICKTYDNTYYGWGSNGFGQLGHIEYGIYHKPIKCDNYPDNIISIKCGSIHTLLLTLEGNLYSFGSNHNGQLGLNENTIEKTNKPTLIRNIPEIKRIECGDNHSMCIDVNNNLWLFGGNNYGQLGLSDYENRYKPIKHPTLPNIMDISSRGYSTFIKTLDHKIFAFGYNEHLELGIKTNKNRQFTPIQVFQDNENTWSSSIGKSKQKSARK